MAIHEIDSRPQRLSFPQRAWCAMMLLVIMGSAACLGVFINDKLHPDSAPVVRMALADLTPQPGFDI